MYIPRGAGTTSEPDRSPKTQVQEAHAAGLTHANPHLQLSRKSLFLFFKIPNIHHLQPLRQENKMSLKVTVRITGILFSLRKEIPHTVRHERALRTRAQCPGLKAQYCMIPLYGIMLIPGGVQSTGTESRAGYGAGVGGEGQWFSGCVEFLSEKGRRLWMWMLVTAAHKCEVPETSEP